MLSFDEALFALSERHYSVLQRLHELPPSFARDMLPSLPKLTSPLSLTLLVAVLRGRDFPGSAVLLWQLVQDPSSQVALPAAQALRSCEEALSGADLLKVLPTIPHAQVRAELLLYLGTRAALVNTQSLTLAVRAEQDPDAWACGVAALVLRKELWARMYFHDLLARCPPARMEARCALAVLVAEPVFARAFLSALQDTRTVFRVDLEDASECVRMCDCATHTLAQLGLRFPGAEGLRLRRYDDALVSAARFAAEALPAEAWEAGWRASLPR